MKCFINGQEIDPSSIGPPAMNFGQHWQYEGSPAYRYRYQFNLDEFLERLGEWFEEFRQEEIRLKKVEDNEGFPQLERFRELQFPTLPVLVHEHPDLLSDLIIWNDQQVLDQLSEKTKPSPVFYSTNSLESLTIEPPTVAIEGIAYGITARV